MRTDVANEAATVIEQTLTVIEKARAAMAKDDSVLMGEYLRAVAVLDAMDTAAALTLVVRYYEARIAKMEVDNARHSILKDAIRDVLREERDGDVR